MLFFLLQGCQCQPKKISHPFQLDETSFATQLKLFTEAPHPFGSERQRVLSREIMRYLQENNIHAFDQQFSAPTPNPEAMDSSRPVGLTVTKHGQNVVAELLDDKHDCIFVVGSHYDTKILPDTKYLGANDSASSSIGLMQLGKFVAEHPNYFAKLKCSLVLVWFDGEESVLYNWNDGEFSHPAKIQDNTYGSRHFVSQFTNCKSQQCYTASTGKHYIVRNMVLMDMIGSSDLKFTSDSYSSPTLKNKFYNALTKMGEKQRWSSLPKPIEDDHIPFLKASIPALNIIDFENTEHWHKHSDLPEFVSSASVALTLQATLLLLEDL